MTLKSFAAVYALHGVFLYFGVKSLPNASRCVGAGVERDLLQRNPNAQT